ANPRDVVALTNYGVVSFHLADYREAARTLADARRLRRRLIDSIPTVGRDEWQRERYERVTAPLDDVARRYSERIEHRRYSEALPTTLVAELERATPRPQ